LRVFQMFSDGKVTQASLAIHAETTDSTPVYDDAGWVELDRQGIGTGLQSTVDGNLLTSCPTVLDVGAHASRYVRLSFKNSGEFGDPSWIEVGAAKLFFEPTLPELGAGCPPEPPSDAVAVGGNASATVGWAAGSTNVTSWSLQVRPVGGSWSNATTDPAPVPGTATTALVTGLVNGTSYEFRVLAANAVASSPYSLPSNAVTPSNLLPATPTNVAANPGEASVTVSWDFVPGATGYLVEGTPSGTCTTTTETTCVITGLTPGLDYTFTVTALNDNGSSGASVESMVVVPQAPPTTSTTVAPSTTSPPVTTAPSTTAPGSTTTAAPTTVATTTTLVGDSGGSLPITGRSGAIGAWAVFAVGLGALCWTIGRRERGISLVDSSGSDQTR
jgi:Fibronectin type III domain